MVAFIARRIVLTVPVLFGLSLVLFFYIRALPGDPAQVILGEHATPESLERLRRSLGLDQPLLVQYVAYLGSLIRMDLGTSAVTRRPVLDDFLQRFPATVELALAAMIVATLLGIPLGIAAARRAGSRSDLVASTAAIVGISIPVFVLGLGLQYAFAVELQVLPAIGRIGPESRVPVVTNLMLVDTLLAGDLPAFGDAVSHLLLPAITLATIPLAIIARITRASTIEVLGEDYVRTAHAKGLPQSRIDRRHVLRNAMPAIVTVIGLQTGALLAGAVITEGIFGWGGVGAWIVNAIRAKDYVVIQSGILLIAVIYTIVNLLVDITSAAVNPRLKVSG